MRLVVPALMLISLAACGQNGAAPAAPEAQAPATAPSEPPELGVTESSIDCPLQQAVYTEPQSGYQLRFRRGEPWEMGGMTESIFDLVFPDGQEAWGYVSSNMGTSRDTGHLFHGCKRPGPYDDDLTEKQIADCRVWEGLVYSLNKGEPGFLTSEEGDAPERILMTDIGRKVRYSGLVDSPGDEPWDVFTFKSCAPPTPKREPGEPPK